ncbi:MAG: insulinase family protein [Lachnospiraceae bacterium]|nr:insulinase family protein [Lachnospiraceae bacterium]
MSYTVEEKKQGIKIHYIQDKKYKTNLITMFITNPLNEQTVTKNALITSILRMGTKNINTQEEINKKLENMYGAEFNCGVEKLGDNQLLKFYIEVLNDEFVPEKKKLLKESLDLLFEIAFNPLVEEDGFKKDYMITEKNSLKQLIESRPNSKDQYAFERCIEHMYKGSSYSIFKYGKVEDLENINEKELYTYYKQMIEEAKIDIYISGDYDLEEIKNIVSNNENMQNLNSREPKYVVGNEQGGSSPKESPDKIEDKMDVTQGKLVIGLNIENGSPEKMYEMAMYNVILGGSATSKLFQNVREKASLAYTARSVYVRQKDTIFIRCGIEIDNYDKAVEIINQQLEDMKNGIITDEEINSSKNTMITSVKTIQDEQDTQITYFIGKELSNEKPDFEAYIDGINSVTKEKIVQVANSIKTNTIYFLTNA